MTIKESFNRIGVVFSIVLNKKLSERRVFKQLTKSTYILETDEEDGMGLLDESS